MRRAAASRRAARRRSRTGHARAARWYETLPACTCSPTASSRCGRRSARCRRDLRGVPGPGDPEAGPACPRRTAASTRSRTSSGPRATGRHGFAFLGFDGDELVGSFSVMEIDQERHYGEIGYWVAAGARGRGVATRAVTLLRDWAAHGARRRADRAAHPRGQRAVEACRRADGVPRHRRAPPRAAPEDARAAQPRRLRLEPRVELERAAGDRVPAVRAVGRGAGGGGHRVARAGSPSSAVSAPASASASPGRHELRGAGRGDLREAADGASAAAACRTPAR